MASWCHFTQSCLRCIVLLTVYPFVYTESHPLYLLSHVTCICDYTEVKRFLHADHASRVGEKTTVTR